MKFNQLRALQETIRESRELQSVLENIINQYENGEKETLVLTPYELNIQPCLLYTICRNIGLYTTSYSEKVLVEVPLSNGKVVKRRLTITQTMLKVNEKAYEKIVDFYQELLEALGE